LNYFPPRRPFSRFTLPSAADRVHLNRRGAVFGHGQKLNAERNRSLVRSHCTISRRRLTKLRADLLQSRRDVTTCSRARKCPDGRKKTFRSAGRPARSALICQTPLDADLELPARTATETSKEEEKQAAIFLHSCTTHKRKGQQTLQAARDS
jgi:hypothetical protein